MIVPFVNLSTQFRNNEKKLLPIIQASIKKGIFIGGDSVATFEKNFASYIGTKHCVSLNSGTDALILGTRALGLHPQDEIIFPANTYYATLLAASENGLKPVLSDADEKDFGYDINLLRKKINARTKAIMVVHLYGQSDKLSEIKSLIKKSGRKIHLLEDACQSHGAKYGGKKVGGFGAFSAFSFYPSKNLGAYGDGGAITTDNKAFADKVRQLKEYGQTKKYHHESIGVNSRLDTLQAEILTYKLQELDGWNKRRQELANLYRTMLGLIPEVVVPNVFAKRKSVYHLFVIRTKQRDELQQYLTDKGVATQIHYPFPIHLQKAWSSLKYKHGDFPVAESMSKEMLSLPMFPELTDREVRYVCISIMNFFYM